MKVLLAVSGGIDSMCMADMFGRGGGECAVAHCNFHLRGADSDADAELVERWAQAHGMRFFRADFDTASYASEHGVSIEMAARELRYAWFAQVAAENGFEAVAVAHNANDNAETLILNLLRGTGLHGITGMAYDRPLPGGMYPENCLAPLGPPHCEQWVPPSYDAEGGTNFQGNTPQASLQDGGRKLEEVEVILALSGDVEGETTAFYIYRQIAGLGVKVSTLARGLGFGDDLEYADSLTLGRSIVNRQIFKP